MNTNSSLSRILANQERISVVGSPSSTVELTLDVLAPATTRKLVGEFAVFQYVQDGAQHYALGQITNVELRNVWHEDSTMRSLIRQRGRVDAVSERQDTHVGKLTVSAVFSEGANGGYRPSMLGTVPPTGTEVRLVSDEVFGQLLANYQSELFYLGQIYGSQPKLPMWFKHFDSGNGGAGEAYHIGIFGKTGSGKSALAKMLMLGYARHPRMGIVVLDPQGEFTKDFSSGGGGAFSVPVRGVCSAFGKDVRLISVKQLVLDRWDLFREIVKESTFFSEISISSGKKAEAADALVAKLKGKKINLKDLHERKSFDDVWSLFEDEKFLRNFLFTEDTRNRLKLQMAEVDKDKVYADIWSPLATLFSFRQGAVSVSKALEYVLEERSGKRPVLVLDLSERGAHGMLWNEEIQLLVLRRVFQGLEEYGEEGYRNSSHLNTLVIIDEAHRLAPRGSLHDNELARSVRAKLVDAVRTTRKYGLGWLFISQTLASLDQEILQQLRVSFFGFGLGMGSEYEALRQLAGGGGAALDLYRTFRDPASAFDSESREHAFMTIGPVSPLSFSGAPLFLSAFNSIGEFLDANNLVAKGG